MEIGTMIMNSLEKRIKKGMHEYMRVGESSLVTMKKVFLDIATENILLTGQYENLVNDFGFLLDYLEKCTDFTLIGKIKMYNTYIQKMIQYFNLNTGRNGKKIKSIVVPNFTHERKEFKLIEEKNQIIFTHGYDANHTGKEAAIALFQYIDSNFIKEKSPYKVKDKG